MEKTRRRLFDKSILEQLKGDDDDDDADGDVSMDSSMTNDSHDSDGSRFSGGRTAVV